MYKLYNGQVDRNYYTKVYPGELHDRFPYTDWKTIFAQKGFKYGGGVSIYVRNKFLEEMAHLFRLHKYSNIVSFAIWHWISLPLSVAMRKVDPEECAKLVFNKLPTHAAMFYYHKKQEWLDKNSIRMHQIIQSIQYSLNIFINDQDWLSDEEKREILKFLHTIKIRFLSPKEIFESHKKNEDYPKIELGDPFTRILLRADLKDENSPIANMLVTNAFFSYFERLLRKYSV